MQIPFNRPPYTGNEDQYILKALKSDKISGDGYYGKLCQAWFENKLGCKKALLTPSCTASLEMAAILLDIKPGDEIIMPSYTFVSTANAFVLRGAKIVFVDIRPDTMNIDETKIEFALTKKTKAIVVVHYAGVGCEMDAIMDLANRNGVFVIEDAAQGMMSKYKGKFLGTIGHLGAYSFHETKNYTSGGEGGLLIINDDQFLHRSEIIREKGTNRSQFFRGQVDKYTWVDIGSSYLPSELQASYLWGQLEMVDKINEARLLIWNEFHNGLEPLQKLRIIDLPNVPDNCFHNGHMYYIKVDDLEQRSNLIKFLSINHIGAVFHYIPLHSAPAGKTLGKFIGQDSYTTSESERLLRLPIFYGMSDSQVKKVINKIFEFFNK